MNKSVPNLGIGMSNSVQGHPAIQFVNSSSHPPSSRINTMHYPFQNFGVSVSNAYRKLSRASDGGNSVSATNLTGNKRMYCDIIMPINFEI